MMRPCAFLVSLVLISAMMAAARQSPDLATLAGQNSPAAAANTGKPKPKKVWTNDNLGDSNGTISIVGDPNKAQGKPQSKAAATSNADKSVSPQVLAKLRDELQKLQAQLTVVDQQLSDLKDLSKGEAKSSGGVKPSLAYDSSSVDEQIRHLQEKKAKIQGVMDDLYDAARAAGIEPGQLR
jgi:small-conductance mechanosensitive channel